MNVKLTILAFVALATLPMVANAAQPTKAWYVLNPRDGTCDSAQAAANKAHIPSYSPAVAETAYRNAGMFQRIDIVRDDNGAIISVDVVTNLKNDMMVSFFATKDACDMVRKNLVDDGKMANPDELKQAMSPLLRGVVALVVLGGVALGINQSPPRVTTPGLAQPAKIQPVLNGHETAVIDCINGYLSHVHAQQLQNLDWVRSNLRLVCEDEIQKRYEFFYGK